MSVLTEEMAGAIYQATLIKVLDGDTVDLHVNLGLGFQVDARIRLLDVGCPEIFAVKHTSEEYGRGFVAKSHTAKFFYDNDPPYYLQAEHKGIHGRWLGQIWSGIGENSLNDLLIDLGYGNGGWAWFSQEPLINDWFNRNPVTAPGGQELEAWYNWGRPVFIGCDSVLLSRLR